MTNKNTGDADLLGNIARQPDRPQYSAPAVPDDISLCRACSCMTHTIGGKCGKCGAGKADVPEGDELRRIIGICDCNTKDMTCWYWRNFKELEDKYDDYDTAINQIDFRQEAAIQTLLRRRELMGRIGELKACLSNVPMPALSYEQAESRPAALKAELAALEAEGRAMLDTLRSVHDFLNSHWIFSFMVSLLFYWLFYRQGYKAGLKAAPTGDAEGRE